MTESQLLAGRWTLPTVEDNQGGLVHMHVSVQVPEVDGLAGVDVGVAMSAAGQPLELAELDGPGRYVYLATGTVTAVARATFHNPTGAPPDTVTVTIEGESATFAVTVRDDDPDLPVS